MALVSEDDGLHFLPSVFHLADLTIRLGWPPKAARRYLYHWKMHGQVVGLGGQSGIYANLVADQYPHWELALRMMIPTAVVIGIEVLRRAGWTTQIPYVPVVAVNAAQPVREVDHFVLEALPQEWYNLMGWGIQGGEAGGLPHLKPAWALADLIRREGWCNCGLGPDDIYWYMVTEQDRQDWGAACSALHLELAPMNPEGLHD